MTKQKIYSLGHSNMSIENFINILIEFNIVLLLDVRSNPISSYVPHFNRENLEKYLKEKTKIRYIYCGEFLGGRQNLRFEKYIQTSAYQSAIEQIEKFIDSQNSAIMCSEKDYINCHRKFICETLLNRGYNVIQVNFSKSKPVKQTNILGFTENEKK